MTVKQLKELLNGVPDDVDVLIGDGVELVSPKIEFSGDSIFPAEEEGEEDYRKFLLHTGTDLEFE